VLIRMGSRDGFTISSWREHSLFEYTFRVTCDGCGQYCQVLISEEEMANAISPQVVVWETVNELINRMLTVQADVVERQSRLIQDQVP
jgi:hypothetical protein